MWFPITQWLIFLVNHAVFFFNNHKDTDVKLVCGNTYSGPAGETENEVNAIMKYFKEIRPVLGAIDFHAYYQAVLYPYGKLLW